MSDSLSILSNGVKDANPFDDESEEWDDAGYELTDDGKAGEPVRYAASHWSTLYILSSHWSGPSTTTRQQSRTS